jgi:hypothetical protein
MSTEEGSNTSEDDSHVRINTKAATAILVTVLGIGGANFYTGKTSVDDLTSRVKSMQVQLRAHSPKTALGIQSSVNDLRTMFLLFESKELSVREQHRLMEEHLHIITEILKEEEGSDNRFHRSMDILEQLLRDILRNQYKIHESSNVQGDLMDRHYHPPANSFTEDE